MKKLGCIVLILMCTLIMMTGCTKKLNSSDLIIKVDKKSIVKVSEEDIVSFFQKNKDNFKAISDYALDNSEKVFHTTPVIISKEMGINEIEDERIKTLVNTLFEQDKVKVIQSQDFEGRYTTFEMGYEYGSYEQGIKYASNKSKIDEDKTEYNYVKEYTDLGDGWFYYLYYYNKIKDEDGFRKNAWDTLSENSKKSVTNDWHKGIVTLKDWAPIDKKTGKVKQSMLVVSVCFNTDQDGLLGPITMYLDPSTKKVLGTAPRF